MRFGAIGARSGCECEKKYRDDSAILRCARGSYGTCQNIDQSRRCCGQRIYCKAMKIHQLILKDFNGLACFLCFQDGGTPLFIACQGGHVSLVKELINCGANVNSCMKVSPKLVVLSEYQNSQA